MAELDQVYGSIPDDNMNMNIQNGMDEQQYEKDVYKEQQSRSHQQPEYASSIQAPPQQVHQEQMHQAQKRQYAPSYSFWDRMTLKRTEVIKLSLFSLVILLAIALDKISNHYLSKYISENVLTDTQEFMIRLSYPVVIFLILWIAKSL